VPVLIGLGWLLLVAAWIGGNPPFAGPDEEWHYLRSLGVSEGVIVGAPAHGAGLGANAVQVAWTDQATRRVPVPAGKAPASAACYVVLPERPATCLDSFKPPASAGVAVTPVGTYEPLPYLLPAVAVGVADRPAAALRLGRVASALIPAVLLGLALAALWTGSLLSVVGLVLAVTPMAVFSVALLNGSGIEIAAAICFAASLLRLVRRGSPAPRWVWAAVAVSGVSLALSRSGSPVWLVLILAATLSPGGAREAVRGHRRAALMTGTALLLAVVGNRVWEAVYGPDIHAGLEGGSLRLTIHEWWHAASDLVGRFGYLETRVPLLAIVTWFALVGVLVALALWLGSRRERVVLAVTTLGALVVPAAFWLIWYRHTGFDLQGRHVLPVMVVVPLLAGEIAWRRRERLGAQVAWLLPVVSLGAAGVIQLVGWWTYARRSAVGVDGPLWFIGDAAWSPPVGWGLWAVLAMLGAASLVAAAALAARSRGGHSSPRPRGP
jgi:predicted membrane protein DUF2142